jgi:peptidoglycan/xylan/chitin deacetylase (PgdA/CDA1 family)
LNFHGLGTPHADVKEDEAPHWCPEDEYKRFLDAVVDLRKKLKQTTEIRITFDDGNKSDLAIGVPALVERGLDATFFICSERLDDPVYLNKVDLADMRAQGMQIGCHGATHIPLRGLDDPTLKAETVDARAALSTALGDEVSSFAIPFGSYDRRVLAALKTFDEVHTSDFQISRSGARMVTRHGYYTGWTVQDLEAAASNLPSGPKALLGRAKLLIKRVRP